MAPDDSQPDQRDPIVARALGQVPVPPRPPDFLDRLDEALDAVDEERRSGPGSASTTTALPAPPLSRRGEAVPIDLTDSRTEPAVADLGAARRTKTGRRYRLLAAAAVAVIVAGVSVLAGDDGTTSTTAVEPADGGEQDPQPGGAAPTPEAEASRKAALESAVSAVMDWSRAVDNGDPDPAWKLMGPLSLAYLKAQGGWEDMLPAMAEGSFGRWYRNGLPTDLSAPPHRDTLGPVPTRVLVGGNKAGSVQVAFLPGTEDAAVVTLSAVLELEGSLDRAVDAFPLTRREDGVWQIEPFAFGPGDTPAEFVSPGLAPGGGLADVPEGFTLEVAAPGSDQVSVNGNFGEFRPMQPAGADRWVDPFSKGIPGGTGEYVVVTRGADFLTAHPARFFVRDSDPVACENIPFTPNSDDLAPDIKVISGDCAKAHRLVRHVHADLNHSFSDGPRIFTALGYECSVTVETEGLESGAYTCTNGPTKVTWSKT